MCSYPPRELANGEFETRFCNVCPIWRWPDIGGNALSNDYSWYTRHNRTTLIRPHRHPDLVRLPCGLPTAQAKAVRMPASRTAEATEYVYRKAFRPDKLLAPR